MTKYLVGNRIIPRNSDDLSSALESARKKGYRVFCLCSDNRPELSIVSGKKQYHTRRKERDEHLHAEACFHYSLPSMVSGHKSISEAVRLGKHGETIIKAEFRLSKRGNSFRNAPSEEINSTAVDSSAKPMTLRSFFHYIYEKSGLTEWLPGFQNKRSYGVFKRRISDCSENIMLSGGDLSSRLFIPDRYVKEKKHEQNDTARRWFESLGRNETDQKLAIVMGEVVDINETRYGGRITFKHLYKLNFFMTGSVYKKLNRRCGRANSLLNLSGGGCLLACATCKWTGKYPLIDEISIMCVNRNWLPFESSAEAKCLDFYKDRAFSKTLRFNEKISMPMSSLVLKDTNPNTAVFVLESGVRKEKEAIIRNASTKCRMKSCIWIED